MKFFESLPPAARGFIAVGGTAAGLFAAYKIYQYYADLQATKETRGEINAAANEAENLKRKGIKPTLNEVQQKNIVNGIKVALLGYDAITRAHVSPLYRELVKIANDLDMLNVINSYGVQTIDFPVSKFTVNDFTGNFSETLKKFLNRDELNAANGIFARKGIKYRL